MTGVFRPRMFCITTGLVRMDSYIGIARLVLLVTMHLVLCFFPCRQAPDARHHGRLGPQDSVEAHRCSSWTRFFSMPVGYECLGPDSAFAVHDRLNGSILQACTDRNMLVSVPYHASSGVTLSNFGLHECHLRHLVWDR